VRKVEERSDWVKKTNKFITNNQISQELVKMLSEQQRTCIICGESPPDVRLQCGHAILCSDDARYLQERGECCPICRAQIANVQEGHFTRTFVPLSGS